MKVLKFGGTSVGSVNSILSVKKIAHPRAQSLRTYMFDKQK